MEGHADHPRRKCIYGTAWVLYLLTWALSIAYAVLAVLVLSGLVEFIGATDFGTLVNVGDRLVGVGGSCAVLIFTLCVYGIYSAVILCRSLFRKNDLPDFGYGMLVGMTFLMVFVTLQTAFVLHSSQYLAFDNILEAQNPEDAQPTPVFANYTDDALYTAATAVGYLTSALFTLLFVFLLSYQCAVACDCCGGSPADEEQKIPEAKKVEEESGADKTSA